MSNIFRYLQLLSWPGEETDMLFENYLIFSLSSTKLLARILDCFSNVYIDFKDNGFPGGSSTLF